MTAAEQVERIFREEHGRVLAALISQFEDFDLAEDALQDALVNVLERWQGDGIPENPGAWLTAPRRPATGVFFPSSAQTSEASEASEV